MDNNKVILNRCVFAHLIRESEQLRILKNFISFEEVFGKQEIATLIKAMDMEADDE